MWGFWGWKMGRAIREMTLILYPLHDEIERREGSKRRIKYFGAMVLRSL